MSKTLQIYRENLELGKNARMQHEGIWKTCLRYYRGHFYRAIPSERHETGPAELDKAAVNVTKATVDAMLASAAIRDPKFTAYSRKPETVDAAAVVGDVANYWWRRYNIGYEFRRALKDRLIYGHGWCKAIWTRKEEEREPTPDVVFERLMETSPATGMEDPIIESVNEPYSALLEEHPTVARISPWDVYVDPEASTMKDATWICQRFWRPVVEVQNDGNYKPDVRRLIGGTALVTPDKVGDNHGEHELVHHDPANQSGNARRVLLYEYHDLVEGTFAVWSKEVNKFLVEPEESGYSVGPHDSPFEMIRGAEVPGLFYPMGEVEALLTLQQELNETRTQLLQHRTKYARKYLVADDSVDDRAIEALKSKRPNEVVRMRRVGYTNRLEDAIRVVDTGEQPHELYSMTDIILKDIERVSGVTEFHRGIASTTRRSATEAAALSEAGSARTADLVETVERAAVAIAERLAAMAQQFLTGEHVVRIVGRDDAEGWQRFDAAAISGQYDFEIEYGSMQPRDDASMRHDTTTLLQVLAPYFADGQLDPMPLIERLLAAFGIADAAKLFPQQQGPAEPQNPQQFRNRQPIGDGRFPTDPKMTTPPRLPNRG